LRLFLTYAQRQLLLTLRAATVAVAFNVAVVFEVVVVVAVAVAFEAAFDVGPRLCTAVTPVPKSDKKAALSERSEFGGLPDFGAGGAGTPAQRGRHSRGRLFLPTSFGEAKEVGRPPGRTPGLAELQGLPCCVTGVISQRKSAVAFDVGSSIDL
jgi:hypothetical protein